jgi:hypothetical protein
VFEGLQHRLLGHVLGVGFVPQNREGGGVHAAFVGTDQLVKKIVFASQHAPDHHPFVELFGWRLQRNHPFQHRFSPHR